MPRPPSFIEPPPPCEPEPGIQGALKRLWRRLAPAAHLADAVSCSAPASPASASPSSTASPWRQTSPVKACAGDTPEVRVNGGSESL